MGATPAKLTMSGWTTPSMKPAATPASIALPPASRTRAAACAASGCPAATIHRRPITWSSGPSPPARRSLVLRGVEAHAAYARPLLGSIAPMSRDLPGRRHHLHHGRQVPSARTSIPPTCTRSSRPAACRCPCRPSFPPLRSSGSRGALDGLLLTGGGDMDPASSARRRIPRSTTSPPRATRSRPRCPIALERGSRARGVPWRPGAQRGARRHALPGRGHRARHPDPAQPEGAARPAHPQGEGHAGQPARRDAGHRRHRGQQHASPGDQPPRPRAHRGGVGARSARGGPRSSTTLRASCWACSGIPRSWWAIRSRPAASSPRSWPRPANPDPPPTPPIPTSGGIGRHSGRARRSRPPATSLPGPRRSTPCSPSCWSASSTGAGARRSPTWTGRGIARAPGLARDGSPRRDGRVTPVGEAALRAHRLGAGDVRGRHRALRRVRRGAAHRAHRSGSRRAAGRERPARARRLLIEALDGTDTAAAQYGRWLDAAYLDAPSPQDATLMAEEIRRELPRDWFTDTLMRRIATRVDDPALQAQAEASIDARGRALLRGCGGSPARAWACSARAGARVAPAPRPARSRPWRTRRCRPPWRGRRRRPPLPRRLRLPADARGAGPPAAAHAPGSRWPWGCWAACRWSGGSAATCTPAGTTLRETFGLRVPPGRPSRVPSAGASCCSASRWRARA